MITLSLKELCKRKPKHSIKDQEGAHNFYWASIVHTILPSSTLPPTAPGRKKEQKQTFPRAYKKKSRWEGRVWR
jgi:hypothetical protein